MARWTMLFALLLLVAPQGVAQPPMGGPSRVEVEEAQQRALRERLLARRPEVSPPPSRDPRVERAIERLRAAGLDRVSGPEWAPPRGRGHRFGADLEDRPVPIVIDADRRVTFDGHPYGSPGPIWYHVARRRNERLREGVDGRVPVTVWADPSLPAELIWTIAWSLKWVAREVRLVVSTGKERPDWFASPALASRFESCDRELATGADPVCLEELIDEALQGCQRLMLYPVDHHPFDLVLDPSLLFEPCGPEPLVDPSLFESVWRFWLYETAPYDTEYLLIDPDRPPPRSARTVQRWVRHLMREQLDE